MTLTLTTGCQQWLESGKSHEFIINQSSDTIWHWHPAIYLLVASIKAWTSSMLSDLYTILSLTTTTVSISSSSSRNTRRIGLWELSHPNIWLLPCAPTVQASWARVSTSLTRFDEIGNSYTGYQLLRKKFAILSQFLADEHIRAQLQRDQRYFQEHREELNQMVEQR